MLDEAEVKVKVKALEKLDAVVPDFWAEISDALSEIECLYEDESFPQRGLAALVRTPHRLGVLARGRLVRTRRLGCALVRARQWVYGRAEAAAARAARAAHAKAQAVGASGMSTADAEAAGEAGLPPWLINPIRAMQMTQAQLDERRRQAG